MTVRGEDDPISRLRRLINGYQVSQALHVLAVLEIPDRLANGPLTAAELAEASGAAAEPLYRLLRAVATTGVIEEQPDRRFRLADIGAALRSDVPGSLAGWAAFIGRGSHWETWSRLLDGIRTGDNPFGLVHSSDPWTYRHGHPAEAVIFNRAMNSASDSVARSVADAYDFSRFQTIVDVGGGGGVLLAAILARHPQARGVLFDLPHVVADSRSFIEQAGLLDRCSFEGGSFFEKVPSGGDAYLLKSILHDWSDGDAVRILRTCHAVMRTEAPLLVIERIVGPPNEGFDVKFSDLNMFVGPGGRERTLEEWIPLFASGGFELRRVVDANGSFVLELWPANARVSVDART